MNDKEIIRQQMQATLDAQKTQKARNIMGQFSTPYPLALDIMQYMKSVIGKDGVSFIEPSIGTGVFYSAYTEVFSGGKEILGFEIDPHYFNPSKEFWKGTGLQLRQGDFLTQTPDCEYDMLVTNPPYVRHHHIDVETKKRLQADVQKKTGIRVSGLAGLYCYFMLLSSAWLKKDGLSCWIVPCEFMDVNYGEAVKKYLTDNVQLLHIHRFNDNEPQFKDALVSSCIVVFRNEPSNKDEIIKFSMGGSINSPENVKFFTTRQLKPDTKWTNLFTGSALTESAKATIGDFFYVKRGIATGDNSFFIIDQNTIDRYEIPQLFLRPILPGPRYIKGDCIGSENGLPDVDRRLFLFSCNLPENIIKEQFPKVWLYILSGYERGVQNSYICSHRKPWYSCEEREPAAIIVPYMGRAESSRKMFRFILNTSNAITTNVYLMLYPKPEYAHYMKQEATLKKVWHNLNTISSNELVCKGRFYGGGLRKMEPNELKQTPAGNIGDILTGKAQLSLF
jgi:hypothetical protein